MCFASPGIFQLKHPDGFVSHVTPALPFVRLPSRRGVSLRFSEERKRRIIINYFRCYYITWCKIRTPVVKPGIAVVMRDVLALHCPLADRGLSFVWLRQAVPEGFHAFAIAEMNAKSAKLSSIRKSWRFFKKYFFTAYFPQVRDETRHVMSWQRPFRQSPLGFTCVERDYSQKVSFTNRHRCETLQRMWAMIVRTRSVNYTRNCRWKSQTYFGINYITTPPQVKLIPSEHVPVFLYMTKFSSCS